MHHMLGAGIQAMVSYTMHDLASLAAHNVAGEELDEQLTTWLNKVEGTEEPYPIQNCKAVIAPHAGYTYSGPAAAWAYKSIDTTGIKRVFILGPSHHYYLEGCALSRCSNYRTPIGDLPLDADTIQELKETGHFETMSVRQDQEEHSIEMHLPYVRKIFEDKDIKIVPILVGSIRKEREAFFGQLLAPYLAAEDTFFVVSSDFCHWGTRFDYTFYYPSSTADSADNTQGYNLSRSKGPSSSHEIHESISRLDHEAMDILTVPPFTCGEAHDNFAEYLTRTRNTICGRHPIGVLFGALTTLANEEGKEIKPKVKWVRYEQSSQCKTLRDSSVSYASAYVRF